MRIAGEWLRCEDLVTRPVINVRVMSATGRLFVERFLIDSGADRTVLIADLLRRVRLPIQRPPTGLSLVGVGGTGDFVMVRTVLAFQADDGVTARVHGEYAAFTDPEVTDMSILGRDVLDNFDVILSRRREEVLLLAPNHQYRVVRP
jgi:hypothetical protein